jgi:DNA-binding MarR family transcriptional regulator
LDLDLTTPLIPPDHHDSIHFERAFRRFHIGLKQGVMARVKDELGFVFTDFPVLYLVKHGKHYPTDIRKATQLSASMVSHMIDRSIKAQLIVREIDAEDSRKTRLSLTPEGQRILDLVNDVYHQSVLSSGATQAEVQQATSLLEKLAPAFYCDLEKK